MDPLHYTPSAKRQLVGTMFDVEINAQLPAPAAPGSDTSAGAALARSLSKRQRDQRDVMATIAAEHPTPISRDRIHAVTGIPVATLCAILSDRELRGLYLEKVDGACRSTAKPSLHVDGYRLNAVGLARVRGKP